ncbi:MAG: phosphate/phosphite/phosphonate ABC transporter substrate-binding protein [Holosporales bacterium]|jgi:phosphonate transport system substrate-binding protein
MARRFIFLGIFIAVVGMTPFYVQAGEQKPLVFALQKQKDASKIKDSADAMMKELTQALGREVKVLIPGEYSATVQALVGGHADVGYISSLPFLLAKRDGGAELLLVEERQNRDGSWQTYYDAVLVARTDGKIDDFEDIKANAKSLRLVFTSHTSTSGYVFPFAFFREQGILKQDQKPEEGFAQVYYAGGYSQALEQVITGKADIAAVSSYTVEGDKTAIYISPEDRLKLKVVARIPRVPTHIIATKAGLSSKERADITKALLRISKDNPDLLTQIYGAARLVHADENTHLEATRKAIDATKLPIHGLVK